MHDWTQGPARWIAAVILGGASIAGMTWSIATRRPIEIVESTPQPVGEIVDPASLPPTTPTHERATGPTRTQQPAPLPSGRINLNTAGAAELQLLTGIGPTLAARIIEDREANGPFTSVEDLDRVRGIGPRTIENIADMATVGD